MTHRGPVSPDRARRRAATYLGILRALGHEPTEASSLLDFGCGNGALVQSLLHAGFEAHGCDLSFPSDPSTDALRAGGALALIQTEPYRLPYPDSSFDTVISNQVFEHVLDYAAAVDEIARVLKSGGVALHIFPSRWSIVEVHSHVPAAGFFRPRWWLSLWAHVGVRMEYQSGMTAAESASSTQSWLRQNTNYHDREWIRSAFERRFRSVAFCEAEFLRQRDQNRLVGSLVTRIPIAAAVYSALRSRVVFTQKR